MFTFTQHLSLSRRRRWKPAQAHWWLGLQLASSGYNVQDHWSLFTLFHWTGWQQNSSVRTQNAVTDCTLYSVQVYSAVYYWCTVDTWSLLHCTGMRSGHYGFECKHRQGFLCMFIYRRIGRIRISDPQFWYWYCDVMITKLLKSVYICFITFRNCQETS